MCQYYSGYNKYKWVKLIKSRDSQTDSKTSFSNMQFIRHIKNKHVKKS